VPRLFPPGDKARVDRLASPSERLADNVIIQSEDGGSQALIPAGYQIPKLAAILHMTRTDLTDSFAQAQIVQGVADLGVIKDTEFPPVRPIYPNHVFKQVSGCPKPEAPFAALVSFRRRD